MLLGCSGPSEPAPAPATPHAATAEAKQPASVPIEGLREIPLPVAPGSTSPGLHAGPQERLYLVWLEPTAPEGHVLRLAHHGAGGWSDAMTVVKSDALLVNWADVPTIVTLADGTIFVAWPEEFEGREGYGVKIARSTDGGASFSQPIALEGEATGPEFGFVSLVASDPDQIRAYWLDSREKETGGAMQLRTATLGRKGPLRASEVIDDRVCDCCQTDAVTSALGELVVYRDRTNTDVRDVYIGGGGLEAGGVLVHADGWEFAGCPVNGPAISARERELAVAWFSGKTPPGRVDVSFTADPRRFGGPIRVDGGKPVGRVDVQLAPDGAAFVTWMEYSPDDPELAEIRVRSVRKDGRVGEPRRVAVTAASREAGFPRTILLEDRMVWVWTDPGQQGMSKVRAAEAPVSALQ